VVANIYAIIWLRKFFVNYFFKKVKIWESLKSQGVSGALPGRIQPAEYEAGICSGKNNSLYQPNYCSAKP
jgi:hypothetical protein